MNNLLTKPQAIDAMKAGKKVRHRHFGPDEWVSSNPQGTLYTFEDGVTCHHSEFWRWRTDPAFEKDWMIILENTNQLKTVLR